MTCALKLLLRDHGTTVTGWLKSARAHRMTGRALVLCLVPLVVYTSDIDQSELPDNMKSELSKLKNIGKVSEQWLHEMGIYTRKDLAELGAAGAYHALKLKGRDVSLVFAYAVEGALLDMHWNALPLELKERLRQSCTRDQRLSCASRFGSQRG